MPKVLISDQMDPTAAEIFRANGVDACWLIDPYERWVEVFQGVRDGERLATDTTLETPVMPGFSLPQSELFAVLDR